MKKKKRMLFKALYNKSGGKRPVRKQEMDGRSGEGYERTVGICGVGTSCRTPILC